MQLSEKLGSATALAAQLAAAGSNTRWRNPPGPDVGGKSNNFSVVISTGKYKKQDFMNIAILILSGMVMVIVGWGFWLLLPFLVVLLETKKLPVNPYS